jgi:hypothetical protein
MSDSPRTLKNVLLRESGLFLGLFLVGILLLPLAIYVVGQAVFGDYGGAGFSDFYGRLHYELRTGGPVSWYLVMSPYLGWQALRLTFYAFNYARRQPPLKEQ